MKILEDIRNFADKAHGTQMRKYQPHRYIVHPVRVMETCRKYTDELPILAAALLHDVLEDTDVTRDALYQYLQTVMDQAEAEKTIQLVTELTDVYVKKDFPQFNRRKRKALEIERIRQISPDAQTVKYADILDNSNEIVEFDPDFARVFLRECKVLLASIPDGNAELYELAQKQVNALLEDL